MYFLASIFVLLLLFSFAIQNSRVQTWLVGRVNNNLSQQLGTLVSVKKVDFEFIKTLVLEDVLVQDLHRDTLLYVHKLKVDVGYWNLKKQKLIFSDVTLQDMQLNMIKYASDKKWNYRFLEEAFSSKDTTHKDTSKSAPWDISFDELTLVNSSVIYKNELYPEPSRIMNYDDLKVTGINGKITDIMFDQDTIRASIEYMSAIEKCGFILNNMSCYVKLSPVLTQLDELKIKTPSSYVSTDLTFRYHDYEDYLTFEDSVRMKANFRKTSLDLHDIGFYADELYGISKHVILSGDVSGKVNDLKTKNVEVQFGKYSSFRGNADFKDLTNVDETYLHLNIKNLVTTRSDIEQIPLPPFNTGKTVEVPGNIGLLGLVQFKGTFNGYYNDFVAHGEMTSALGMVKTDIGMRSDSIHNTMQYEGDIESFDFDIGKLLKLDPALGRVSCNVKVNGYGFLKENLNSKLEGNIANIVFNHYNYKNVEVQGNFAQKIFNGTLNVKDENIDLAFAGDIDFASNIPRIDFSADLKDANLSQLRFINSDEPALLSSTIDIDITGAELDDITGSIIISNTDYKSGNEKYHFNQFSLVVNDYHPLKDLVIKSDFADANIRGKFNLENMENSFGKYLSTYLPTYFRQEKKLKVKQEDFEFSLFFKQTKDFTRLFLPELKISSGTEIKGEFNNTTNDLKAFGSSSSLTVLDNELRNWKMDLSTQNGNLTLNNHFTEIYLSDSLNLKNVQMNNVAANDKINFDLTWDNTSSPSYLANIKALADFNIPDKIKFAFLPSTIVVGDSLWTINDKNEILLDSGKAFFQFLEFSNNKQKIRMDGIVSKDKNDTLNASLNNFNLSSLNSFIGSTGLKLKGFVSGTSRISDIYEKPTIHSDVLFNNLLVNNEKLGNGFVKSIWDPEKKALLLSGEFSKGIRVNADSTQGNDNSTIKNIAFDGSYWPQKKENNLDLTLQLQAVELRIFTPFIKEYCSTLEGQMAGKLMIRGTAENPVMQGKVHARVKKVHVNYLNTDYSFEGDINIRKNEFFVDSIMLKDVNGFDTRGLVRGGLYHDNFKNFQLDYDIHARKLLVLNTSAKDNELYYGRAFVSGWINISGFIDQNIQIDADVKTDKVNLKNKKVEMTRFYIPLENAEEVGDVNFITFVKKDSTQFQKKKNIDLSGITMNFNLDLTPDAEVQMIFDSRTGDIIRGTGNGHIDMNITTLGKFSMFGEYNVEGGDYLFTIKNLLNKRFNIDKGGLIKWSGDPYNADINLKTAYRLTTSLSPFFPNDTTGVYKKRYPVDCNLIMMGKLMSPAIYFDIDFPGLDDYSKQQVKGYLNSEQEINNQAFALMAINSFITPSQLAGTNNPGFRSASTSNSAEVLSNQLSNMLSKISKEVDWAMNYRPGDALTSQELSVVMSTQLFNDKVTIDSKVGTSQNRAQNTNSVVGDINVEYKITEDGKVRLKAFNRSNNNTYTISSSPFTQGIGIFYRKEFSSWGELINEFNNRIRGGKTPPSTSSTL